MVDNIMDKTRSFLQSSEWEEFQKLLGREAHRVAGALVIRHDLWRSLHYLYCPRPSIRSEDVGEFLSGARQLARDSGALFLRIDPAEKIEIQNSRQERGSPHSAKFKATGSLQPRKTTILDLRKTEKELFLSMHEKTRYNIRLAERKGVLVSAVSYNNENILRFLALLEETARRDGFRMHERGYYVKLPSVRSDRFYTELFFAEGRGKLLAAAMVNFYRPPGALGTATYLHGASGRELKQLMAPYLMHWRIMQDSKRRGFRHYDFWGVDEKKWPGLTRFKLGFGGGVVEYPPASDVIYRPGMHRFYRLVRTINFRSL